MKKLYLITFIILIAFGCTGKHSQNLYPVPTLIVRQGIDTGFDLLVYKKCTETKFSIPAHPNLVIKYVPGVDSLYLQPRDDAGSIIQLPILADGIRYDLMVKVKPMVKHTFKYPVNSGDTLVVVMGGFNDWSRTALPMSDDDGDGWLERTVYLRPERHEYKFVVNWQEVIDPENPVFISNNIGGWNSILDLSDQQPRPAGRYVKKSTSGKRLHFSFVHPKDGALPALVHAFIDNILLTDQEVDQLPNGDLTVNTANYPDGLLRITGIDALGRPLPENHTILKNGRPLNPSNDPEDWHFAVIYSAMTDRFLDGNPDNTRKVNDSDLHPLADFHGGDLAGIIQKLREGYFSELGVNTLWVFPLNRQPEGAFVESIPPNRKFTGYHGYWPVRGREIDDRFGTEAEFRELVDLAHQQGMKVILDFVSNHTHENHDYFQANPEWYGTMYLPDGTTNIRNWSLETNLTTWFDDFIPSFDFPAAPEAIDQVVADAIWWMETFDLDGFRQDAVKHVPHKFWKQLTAEMKSRFPEKDIYQIGESFGSDDLIKSYVNPGELNSQFNFSIYFNARVPFSSDEADFSYLGNILNENAEVFGPVNLMGNITSSHDQGRFMGFADGQVSFSDNGTERAFNDPPGPVINTTSYDKLVSFTAFNMSLPGVPVIYYGEEMGLMGAADPGNRRPMYFADQWTEDEKQTFDRIAHLVKLRHAHPALSIGDYTPVLVEGPLLVFRKTYFDEEILVAFNQSSETRQIKLSQVTSSAGLMDLATGTAVESKPGEITFDVLPYGHRLIKIGL